jgi:hypothetical protein
VYASVGWSGVEAMLRVEHAELWERVIALHWEELCTNSFAAHEDEFNSSRTPNALRNAITCCSTCWSLSCFQTDTDLPYSSADGHWRAKH